MKYQKKEDKLIKKISLILSLISLVICLSIIKTTYAKYISATEGDASIKIAKWKILVNNQDITTVDDENNKNISSVIRPIFNGTNDIKEGVIAPTAEGYFDLIVDGTNTDVSYKYNITTESTEDALVKDIVLSGYTIASGEEEIDDSNKQSILTDDGNINITKNVYYNDTNKVYTLRIYFKWNDTWDDDTDHMDNNADTNATKQEDANATIKVNINFIQINQNSDTDTNTQTP